jgi:hypothetical protein
MSFADYRRLMGNRPLKLASSTPPSGTLFVPEQPVIAAKIDHFQELEPKSVGMAVLSLGATPYSYNPADGTISLVVREPFKTNRQQAIVWGRDLKTGKRVEATWVFYANELPPKPQPKPVTPLPVEPTVTAKSEPPTIPPAPPSPAHHPRK